MHQSTSGRERLSDLKFHLILVVVAAFWGSNNIVMKLGFDHLSPQQFGAVRMIIAFPFMIYLTCRLPGGRKFEKQDLLKILGIGALGMGMFQVLFPLAVNYTSAPVGGILLATMPVHVVILSLIFRLERPRLLAVAGVLLTIAGLTVITLSSNQGTIAGETTVLGVVLFIFAELGFAIYSTFLRPYMRKYSPLQITGAAMAVSTVIYIIWYFPYVRTIDVTSLTPTAWWTTAFSGLLPLIFANVLWNIAIKHIGSTQASVYGNLPTLFVLLFSALILGELLNSIQLAGSLIVLAGVIMVQVRPVRIITLPDGTCVRTRKREGS